MHLSVEILGGYQAAKDIYESKQKKFYHTDYGWHFDLDSYDLKAMLAEYRAANGLYEAGDEVVLLQTKDLILKIYVVESVHEKFVHLKHKSDPQIAFHCSLEEIRHATLGERVQFLYCR